MCSQCVCAPNAMCFKCGPQLNCASQNVQAPTDAPSGYSTHKCAASHGKLIRFVVITVKRSQNVLRLLMRHTLSISVIGPLVKMNNHVSNYVIHVFIICLEASQPNWNWKISVCTSLSTIVLSDRVRCQCWFRIVLKFADDSFDPWMLMSNLKEGAT